MPPFATSTISSADKRRESVRGGGGGGGGGVSRSSEEEMSGGGRGERGVMVMNACGCGRGLAGGEGGEGGACSGADESGVEGEGASGRRRRRRRRGALPGSHSLSSLAILDAMFLKPMLVPDIRLKRTPLSERRGSLHTSISHWTRESALGSPCTHSRRNLSRCS